MRMLITTAAILLLSTPAMAGAPCGAAGTFGCDVNTNTNTATNSNIIDASGGKGGSADNTNVISNEAKGGTAYGGQGGQGGKGGSASAAALSGSYSEGGTSYAAGGKSNSKSNVSDSGNSASLSEGGSSTSSSTSTGGAVSNSGNSSSNSGSDSGGNTQAINFRYPVASAVAAALASSPQSCMGSSSVGAQGASFGISLGTTWHDKVCERMNYARLMASWGYTQQAAQLLCLDDEVRAVLCPAQH